VDLPAGQVFEGVQTTLLPRSADELAGDVALVEAVVGRVDGLLAGLAVGEGLALRLDELLERREQVGLAQDLPGVARLPLLAQVG